MEGMPKPIKRLDVETLLPRAEGEPIAHGENLERLRYTEEDLQVIDAILNAAGIPPLLIGDGTVVDQHMVKFLNTVSGSDLLELDRYLHEMDGNAMNTPEGRELKKYLRDTFFTLWKNYEPVGEEFRKAA